MKRMLSGCTETLTCLGESGEGGMSLQGAAREAEPPPAFRRSVHFSDAERKPAECGLDDASDSGWARAMSRSAPASCATPPLGESSERPSTARFPRLEDCAHFHYGRVNLGGLRVSPVRNDTRSAHQDADDEAGWVTIRVQSHFENRNRNDDVEGRDNSIRTDDQDTDFSEWVVNRSAENFKMLDTMLHRCIYDRKVSGLPDLSASIDSALEDGTSYDSLIADYLHHFSIIADDTINCGPILNWFQMDNKGYKLLVATEDSSSINTPAVAAAYSVKRYVSQARDEISFEVGDMISVIDMPGPSESTWWRGKRGFRVGFFPQDCVAVIGDKVPRNMKQPPPIVGSVAVAPIKPVLRKHGKLISLFRSFILNRPSRRSLRQQGILRERVFGCDLGEHLLNSGHEVPQVLSWCASVIEQHGCVDGIYRLSGGASATQRLRLAFDEEKPPTNPPSPLDVHAVASLLKMYFRELPNPLCTYQLYSSFVSAVKLSESEDGTELRRLDDAEKLVRMRDTVMKLPPPHYRTLAFLMKHLHNMSLLSSSTGMTARNMGIVWAPNLLRSPHQEFSLSGVAIQVVITEFLICYADLIFSDIQCVPEQSDAHDINGSISSVDQASLLVKRPKSLPIATPTKLLSLEEARNKQQLRPSVAKEPQYIEVGDGPNSLPRYHTIIQLPPGAAKRGLKRSPSGWKGLFFRASKHRTMPSSLPTHPRISEPVLQTTDPIHDIIIKKKTVDDELGEKMTVDDVETRSTRSCESLGSEGDSLPPLINKPEVQTIANHHNRSASCDSYFEASLAELAGMRLRLSSQEREMDIFSEDDTTRQVWNKSSSEDTTAESSPVKPVKPVLSISESSPNHKNHLKIEEELSNLLFIDCSTPEHTAMARNKVDGNGTLSTFMDDERSNGQHRLKIDSPQHATTIKVKMRDRGSPRRNEKAGIARHSHCGPTFSPQKTDAAPHRHSTLIQVGWVDSNERPDMCGYTKLQSDSETSLQTRESKDSLAKRLIESKESLEHAAEDNANSGMLTWASDLMNSCPKSQNICININDGSNRSNASDNHTTMTDIYDVDLKLKTNSSEYEDIEQKNIMTMSSGSEYHYDDADECDKLLIKHKTNLNTYADLDANRCSVAVTPSDENFSCNMPDSLDESLSASNISYQNLNRLSMISGESGRLNMSKESTPTFSSHEQERTEEIYECFSFAKPSYTHLPSSSDGSTPISPQTKSPLKSTISITYKSPVKSDKKSKLDSFQESGEFDEYEDVAIENLATIPNPADASLPTPTDQFDNVKQISDNNNESPQEDCDIYNRVKFFRQSVNEVNSLIMESDMDPSHSSQYGDSLDLVKADTAPESMVEPVTERNYENILYDDKQSHSYENVDLAERKLDNPISPLTELCYDRHCEQKSNAYENYNVDASQTNQGESDKENSDENENLSLSENLFGKRSIVKQLAHKFESPTEAKGPFYFDRSFRSADKLKDSSLQPFDRNKAVSFCEGRGKGNLTGKTMPSMRSRTNRLSKHSSNTRSLDENAFVKEFGHPVLHKEHISEMEIGNDSIVTRRSSIDASKCLNRPKHLPDLNLNTECNKTYVTKPSLSLNLEICNNDAKENMSNFANRYISITPTSENKICLVQARLSPKKSNKSRQFSSSEKDIAEESKFDKKDQLSRERIEKYKEERRMFLREKFSSQSFRGVGEMQLSSKFKSSKGDLNIDEVQLRNPKVELRNASDSLQRNKFIAMMTDLKTDECGDAQKSELPRVSGQKVANIQRKFSLDGNAKIDDANLKFNRFAKRDSDSDASASDDRKDFFVNSDSNRKEKRSPSFNIKDMTALFEPK